MKKHSNNDRSSMSLHLIAMLTMVNYVLLVYCIDPYSIILIFSLRGHMIISH